MEILNTERLRLRELDAEADAAFMYELLNTPKFIDHIGDRGVRSEAEAVDFIRDKYASSYDVNGYGLWAVDERSSGKTIGICGFVRRSTLPGPDIGFAFLPEFEGRGYGTESVDATLLYGNEKLGFERVLAITSPENVASIALLEKAGFRFSELIENPEGENLRLFSYTFTDRLPHKTSL